MTKRERAIIIGQAIQFALTIAIGVIIVRINASPLNASNLYEKKLDKKEFVEYKETHIREHVMESARIEDLKQHFDNRFEDLKDFILKLNGE